MVFTITQVADVAVGNEQFLPFQALIPTDESVSTYFTQSVHFQSSDITYYLFVSHSSNQFYLLNKIEIKVNHNYEFE